MAGVGDGVGAGVAPRACLPTLGGPRAARHRRIDDGRPAGAGQLVKADPRTGLAVTLVAQLLTPASN